MTPEQNERRRQKYAENAEVRRRIREEHERWIAAKKADGTFADRKLKGYLRAYNKTVEWYKAQLLIQGGVCAICGQPPSGGKHEARLAVDHDHNCCSGSKSCGQCVRSLICQPCNKMLGYARDNANTLKNAVNYLESFGPTTTERKGLEVRVCDSLNSCESMRENSEACSPLIN